MDTCKYSKKHRADRYCYNCGDGLCNAGSCGYKIPIGRMIPEQNEEIVDLCNECYEESQKEAEGYCEACGQELEREYEDMHPDGIGYYEVVGYKPCRCRYDNE